MKNQKPILPRGQGGQSPPAPPRPELDLIRHTAEGAASHGDGFAKRVLELLDYTESLETALATLAALTERVDERLVAVEKELRKAQQATGLVGEHN